MANNKKLQEKCDIRVAADIDFIEKNTSDPFDGIHIQPIKFARKNHRINLLGSFFNALKCVKANYTILKKYKPKLCITDYEPSVAWFAFINRVPLITVDNQHRFNYCDLKLPFPYNVSVLKLAIFNKWYIPHPKYSIISSFSDNLKPKFKHASVLNLGVSNLIASPNKVQSIVVYGKEPTYSNIVTALKKVCPNFQLIIYTNESKSIEAIYKKFDRNNFLDDLTKCSYCIGSAGNQLATECNWLGIPFLAVAEDNQIEQILNTKMLPFGCSNDAIEIESTLKKMLNSKSETTLVKKDGLNQAVDIILGELCRY